jgi:PA14 domain
LAPGIPPTGFGSSFLNPVRSVSELDGIRSQAGHGVKVDFISSGSPDPATAAWQPSSGGTEGLRGEYFASNDLSGSPAVTRVDTEVDLDWTQAGVIPSEIPTSDQSTFSVHWTGKVHTQYTGDHLFKVRADGGVRLYVDGQLLIDNFLLPSPPPVYGTTLPVFAKISLRGGQSYEVRLEYRRTTGFAGAKAIILPEFQDELIQNVIQRNPKTNCEYWAAGRRRSSSALCRGRESKGPATDQGTERFRQSLPSTERIKTGHNQTESALIGIL